MADPKPVYRVGRTLGRTLYRDDELIGLLDREEDARSVADAMNIIDEAIQFKIGRVLVHLVDAGDDSRWAWFDGVNAGAFPTRAEAIAHARALVAQESALRARRGAP